MSRHLFTILTLFFGTSFLFAQTGIPVTGMSNCDQLVNDFLDRYDIPAASLAISRNGKLVYERAFGKADLAATVATQPHNLFRLASISKPITSMAVMKMIEEGEIALTDKVFGDGGLLAEHNQLKNASITDARIYDMTVQHFLEHTGGWDRDANCFPNPTSPYPYNFNGCDPIVAPLHVTQTNGTQNPATEEDLITFLLEKGLDFTPGTRYAYSNIGYLVLGEILEEVSGMSYERYVQSKLMEPLGICDMHIGKNLLADQLEREVAYQGNGFTNLSVYGTGQQVPWEYGGFNLE
ncbi:MAG: serine hydrolase domain-containing protein, partial [Bacteroidota bacterium]